MIARYDGTCVLCDDKIEAGVDEIDRYTPRHHPAGWAHKDCIEQDAPLTDRERRENANDKRFGFKR